MLFGYRAAILLDFSLPINLLNEVWVRLYLARMEWRREVTTFPWSQSRAEQGYNTLAWGNLPLVKWSYNGGTEPNVTTLSGKPS
ncbi:hypothetical protein ACQP3C_27320, partial [Escherichia coli]